MNSLGILSKLHLLVDEQIPVGVVAMVMEAEGKENPWAMEAVEVVAAGDCSKPGTGCENMNVS